MVMVCWGSQRMAWCRNKRGELNPRQKHGMDWISKCRKKKGSKMLQLSRKPERDPEGPSYHMQGEKTVSIVSKFIPMYIYNWAQQDHGHGGNANLSSSWKLIQMPNLYGLFCNETKSSVWNGKAWKYHLKWCLPMIPTQAVQCFPFFTVQHLLIPTTTDPRVICFSVSTRKLRLNVMTQTSSPGRERTIEY